MQRIWAWRLPMILSSLMLSTAIAACGEPGGNTPDVIAPTAEEPAVVTEDSPTSDAEPSAEMPPEEVTQAPVDGPAIEVGQITIDELFELNGGGCGMILYAADTSQFPQEQGFLLSNGLDEDSMLMKINGSVVRFQRTDFSGEPFYGQYLSQTFQSADQRIQVSADVVLGEPGEIESVEISEGTLGVEMDGARQEYAVVGDAGC